MPFCPNCRAEYYPEVKRCADCGLPLVESLPEQGAPLPADGPLTAICQTGNRTEASAIRRVLDQYGVPSLLFGDQVLVPNAETERSLVAIKRFFERDVPAAPADEDLVSVCTAPDQFLAVAVAAMLQREGITVVTRERRDAPVVDLLVQRPDAESARFQTETVLNALTAALPVVEPPDHDRGDAANVQN
jgi:hypothetical protein